MKQSLIIDLDDVLVDCAMLHRLNEFLGTTYVEEDFDNYYIQDMIKDPIQKKRFLGFMLVTYFYKGALVKDGAHEILPKLYRKYNAYLCSSFIMPGNEWYGDKFIGDKFRFMKDEFPFFAPSRFMFMGAKQFFDVDIMIDDKITNLSSHAKQRLLFTAWHNKDIPDEELKVQGITRVNSWQEIAKLLL